MRNECVGGMVPLKRVEFVWETDFQTEIKYRKPLECKDLFHSASVIYLLEYNHSAIYEM